MNARSYIDRNLNVVSMKENFAEAAIVFSEDFSAFQGHFPGNPTLPGVCELICAGILLEKALGKKVRLKELSRAKFFSPVLPGESLNIELSWKLEGDTVEAGCKIFCGERKIAFFKNCTFIGAPAKSRDSSF